MISLYQSLSLNITKPCYDQFCLACPQAYFYRAVVLTRKPWENLVRFISGKMLVASNGPVATFALFLFFSFAVISQTSGNQPRNGVGGNYVWLGFIMLGCKYNYGDLYISRLCLFDNFSFIFMSVVCLFTQE